MHLCLHTPQVTSLTLGRGKSQKEKIFFAAGNQVSWTGTGSAAGSIACPLSCFSGTGR